jgi:hypothetical protein
MATVSGGGQSTTGEGVPLERGRELGNLDRVVQAARTGEAATALIEGPAGIAKTRLLAKAREMASGRSRRTRPRCRFVYRRSVRTPSPRWSATASALRATARSALPVITPPAAIRCCLKLLKTLRAEGIKPDAEHADAIREIGAHVPDASAPDALARDAA